jgi:hypothetical protein
MIILAVIYALSPYDFLPDILVGWGWLDDLLVVCLIWWFFFSRKRRIFQDSGAPRAGGNSSRMGSEQNSRFYDEARENTNKQGPSEYQDPHEVLGIGKDASQEEIKRAYRRLANKYHPDKLAHLGEDFRKLAEARFKQIQRSYRELIDK